MIENISFTRILKISIQKMKSSTIDHWHLGYDYFLANFKANNSDLPYAKDISYAFKWKCSSRSLKSVTVVPIDISQFLKIDLKRHNSQKSMSSKQFQNMISKNLEKYIKNCTNDLKKFWHRDTIRRLGPFLIFPKNANIAYGWENI